jgi:hypothetical protein
MDEKERVKRAFAKSWEKYGAVDPHTGFLWRLIEAAKTHEDWQNLAYRIQADGSLRP